MDRLTKKTTIFAALITLSTSIYAYSPITNRIGKLSQEIEIYNNDPALLVRRGRLYADADHSDKAITDYQQALKADPTYYETLYWLGVQLLKIGDIDKAKEALNSYLQVKPRASQGLEAYARTLVKLNNYSAAAKYYDRLIGYNKISSPQTYRERAQALMLIDPIPLKRLEKGLQAGLREHGPSALYFDILVEANIKAEKNNRALFWIEQIPEKIRSTPTWIIKRAQIYEHQDEIFSAIQLYQRLIRKIDHLPRDQQKSPALVETRRMSKKEIYRLKRHY